MRMPSGAILPSYLSADHSWGTPTANHENLTDYVMRMGEVREVIAPDSPKSQSQRWYEYTVDVEYRDGAGITTVASYQHVVTLNHFGGTADRLRATYRPGRFEAGTIGQGSKVLIMCASGDRAKAFIIGGVPDHKFEARDSMTGHHLDFEFNGIGFQINADGELTVKFRGATNPDGTLASTATANAEGAIIQFDKTGSIKLATPSAAQFVKLDHQNAQVNVLADKQLNIQVNKDAQATLGGNLTVTSTGGKANFTFTDTISMMSAGVKVGLATEQWVLGTTYRRQEGLMHQQLSGALTAASSALATASGALGAVAGVIAIPVTGPAMAAPSLGVAVSALATVAAQLQIAATALTVFESQSLFYLSNKNFGD